MKIKLMFDMKQNKICDYEKFIENFYVHGELIIKTSNIYNENWTNINNVKKKTIKHSLLTKLDNKWGIKSSVINIVFFWH